VTLECGLRFEGESGRLRRLRLIAVVNRDVSRCPPLTRLRDGPDMTAAIASEIVHVGVLADLQLFNVLGVAVRTKRGGHGFSRDLTLRMVIPL